MLLTNAAAALPASCRCRCRRCHAATKLPDAVLQLMTPLIHGLTESAEWLAAGTGSSAAAAGNLLQPSDSWEWLTLCVYTCRANCCGDAAAAAAVVEEAVVAANEE